MPDMLEKMAQAARDRVQEKKISTPQERLETLVEFMPIPSQGNPPGTGAFQTFQEALRRNGLSVIAEIDRRATSSLSEPMDFDCVERAMEFEGADADVIAYATEPHWLFGSDEEFDEIRNEICAPMLRRDIVVDPYQIFEAKNIGADAVTLMCPFLDDDMLRKCLRTCNDLYIDAMVEVFDENDVERAIDSGALIIALSNLNLDDMSIDTQKSLRLVQSVPQDCLLVIEHGITNLDEAKAARSAGADAILIGKSLMNIEDEDERCELLRSLTEVK